MNSQGKKSEVFRIDSYESISVKGDFIIAVGGNDTKAVITMGRRQ